ncbi:MAG: HD domain-containing protein [Bacteriovoracaceae bacterium]|jgi:HD superfamily phosphohydrolase|nr:HD domain-containing protein [Bacteriovoracaceae bacterium]
MEVRDPVHGSIHILDEEIPIIEHPFFQRLRNIKQLGFSEYIFPGATHTRYLHSIGVMHISSKVFDNLFKDKLSNQSFLKLKHTVRLACLLHDIGHAPLSHTTEFVMPLVKDLKLPKEFEVEPNGQATHEDYTIKAIVDSNFTKSFEQISKKYDVDPNCVAQLVTGYCLSQEYFTIDGINYFALLHQLVSSEMDCDRMDYLLRDSYFCGVSYGKFDLDWIIDNLRIALVEKNAFLGISQRAVATFDDFLLCRFHMFLMVYFHYKSVCLEKMLKRYFSTSNNEYQIPSDIDEYLIHDDYHLMKILRNSDNKWAKKIVNNHIPKKIFEAFGQSNKKILQNLEDYLNSEQIDYIKCSSSGRLSKYYNKLEGQIDQYSLKVVKESSLNNKHNIQDIHEATDLFEKFSKSHSVDRIHCEISSLTKNQLDRISQIIHD